MVIAVCVVSVNAKLVRERKGKDQSLEGSSCAEMHFHHDCRVARIVLDQPNLIVIIGTHKDLDED